MECNESRRCDFLYMGGSQSRNAHCTWWAVLRREEIKCLALDDGEACGTMMEVCVFSPEGFQRGDINALPLGNWASASRREPKEA